MDQKPKTQDQENLISRNNVANLHRIYAILTNSANRLYTCSKFNKVDNTYKSVNRVNIYA
jgi:hypothetical protein